VDRELAKGSLRFTLGRSSVPGDVDAVLGHFPGVVQRARRAA
jgi:cysteine sulfinate desulfinase/cysteine desulfurase-like protein